MRLLRFFWLPGCCLFCLLLRPFSVCGQALGDGSSSVAQTLALHIPLSPRQALEMSTEYVRIESFPKALAEQFFAQPAWRYKAVPLTVGYTYALTAPDRRIVPIIGVGVSLYVGSVKQRNFSPETSPLRHNTAPQVSLDGPLAFQQRLGIGYGAQATLGIRAALHPRLYLQAQGRARYINGLGLTTNDNHAFHSEFSRLDFAVGFGFQL